MKNRFHLESELMDCWKVINDLDQAIKCCKSDHHFREVINSVCKLYDMKFEVLFDTFKQAFAIDEYAPERPDES